MFKKLTQLTILSVLLLNTINSYAEKKFTLTREGYKKFSTLKKEQPVEESIKVDLGNGKFVYVGGVKLLTEEEIAKIPNLEIDVKRSMLEDKFDNLDIKYLPPVFSQQGGSCAQAAGIRYCYSYALARAKDIDVSSGDRNNIYSYFYTWNYLNNGVAGGSSFKDGWDIGNNNGIPVIADWEPCADYSSSGQKSATYWLNGYDNYYKKMPNRYVDVFKIDVSTEDGIDELKQWVKDGGVATFSSNCIRPLQDYKNNGQVPTCEDGKFCVPAWGHKGGHVMTVVGWNDSVAYDLDEDGSCSNDEDLTGDGTVGVGDWEKGAWVVLNSWGDDWPPQGSFDVGCYYMMYRTGALPMTNAYKDTNTNQTHQIFLDRGGNSTGKYMYVIQGRTAENSVTRALTYKFVIKHAERANLALIAGVSNDITSSEPEFTYNYFCFDNRGGKHPMQGNGESETIEIGIDSKELLNYVDNKEAKFFFIVDSRSSRTGTIESFSVMDYRSGTLEEKACTETNKTIASNAITMISVVYDAAAVPLNIKTDNLADAKQGVNYTHQFEGEGGEQAYKWELKEHVHHDGGVNTSVDVNINDKVELPGNPSPDLPAWFWCSAEQELDFEFPFYGEKYNKIQITTDGNIQFGDEYAYMAGKFFMGREKMIAPLGICCLIDEDGSNGGVYYEGDATKAIIRWKTTDVWGENLISNRVYGVKCDLDFAVVLYPTGKIDFHYMKTDCESPNDTIDVEYAAMGISGGDGYYVDKSFLKIKEIPTGHKFSLTPEKELGGMTMTEEGIFSGTPIDSLGEYNMTVTLKDQMEVVKTKSLKFKIIENTTNIINKIGVISTPLNVTNSNNSVLFSFGISKNSKVSLEAYTVNGKKVKDIFTGKLTTGNHKISWKKSGDKSLAKGVYLCKLTIGNENLVKKIPIFK